MKINKAITELQARNNLGYNLMQSVMLEIMEGKIDNSETIKSFLVNLTKKGETAVEVLASVEVMRKLSTKIKLKNTEYLVDTCGTGGSTQQHFNISTTSAIIASAAGVKIAKHGNRTATRKSGSADVLESLGVNINLKAEQTKQMIEDINIGFMFAPLYHKAMKNVVAARKKINDKTIFNLLGPMTNPAGAKKQIIGVYHKKLMPLFAEVLLQLDTKSFLILHSRDNLDEISSVAPTDVIEYHQNSGLKEFTIYPKDMNLDTNSLQSFKVNNAQESAEIVKQVCNGQNKDAKHIVALNAGAAIYIGGISSSYNDGVATALKVMETGLATKKLNQLINYSNSFG